MTSYLIKSSFPKERRPAGFGNPLFVVQTTITTDPRQKHSGMTIAFAFCFFACRHSRKSGRPQGSGIRCSSLLFSYKNDRFPTIILGNDSTKQKAAIYWRGILPTPV